MPNWCMNQVDITGPADVIDEISDTKLCLQKLFPCPQELLDTTAPATFNAPDKAKSNTEKYGHADWYSWQVSNWGIGPLECDSFDNHDGTKTLSVGFDSAWSPPVEAFKKLFEKYKDKNIKIRLEYFEPGCAFAGVFYTEDGEFIDDCDHYSNADELESIVEYQGNSLAESEIEYLRDREAEEKEEAEAKEKLSSKVPASKKPVKKPAKKAAKKPSKKKTSTKKSAVKPKPAKVSSKKAAKKSKSKKK